MRRFVSLAAISTAVCAAAAGIAGCPEVVTPFLTPITGIDVPISSVLQESGLSCGKQENEVYEYAVVVSYENSGGGVRDFANCPMLQKAELGTPAVSPCYAQAVFGNLPLQDASAEILTDAGYALPDGASVVFWAYVAFYNYRTYLAHQSEIEKIKTGGKAICEVAATWTTTCIATEREDIVANAACDPLVLGSSPPSDAGFEDFDGSAEDAPAGEGATHDAGPDSPHDAGADAPAG